MNSLRFVHQGFDILILQGENGWLYQSSKNTEEIALSSCVPFATQLGAETAARQHVDRQIVRDEMAALLDSWAEKKLIPWDEYRAATRLLGSVVRH